MQFVGHKKRRPKKEAKERRHAFDRVGHARGEATKRATQGMKQHYGDYKGDVDAMHAWWCNDRPSSAVCAVVKWRKMMTDTDGKKKLPPPEGVVKPSKPDFAEIHEMHSLWCKGTGLPEGSPELDRRASAGPCQILAKNPELHLLKDRLMKSRGKDKRGVPGIQSPGGSPLATAAADPF
mmetsp:Transcript_23122/g.52148  ORF Transcript_23122/g.52148 Transcript_23122/m.52148 type:complete len:179 (+) Transcript_23122:109-645(+)